MLLAQARCGHVGRQRARLSRAGTGRPAGAAETCLRREAVAGGSRLRQRRGSAVTNCRLSRCVRVGRVPPAKRALAAASRLLHQIGMNRDRQPAPHRRGLQRCGQLGRSRISAPSVNVSTLRAGVFMRRFTTQRVPWKSWVCSAQSCSRRQQGAGQGGCWSRRQQNVSDEEGALRHSQADIVFTFASLCQQDAVVRGQAANAPRPPGPSGQPVLCVPRICDPEAAISGQRHVSLVSRILRPG
jgi:hypothetical protein